MAPISAFNVWLLNKISVLLANKEGFITETTKSNSVIMQDAFGFRYEITVKMVGRSQQERPLSNDLDFYNFRKQA